VGHAGIRDRFPSGVLSIRESERNGEAVRVDGPVTLDGKEITVEAARQG